MHLKMSYETLKHEKRKNKSKKKNFFFPKNFENIFRPIFQNVSPRIIRKVAPLAKMKNFRKAKSFSRFVANEIVMPNRYLKCKN